MSIVLRTVVLSDVGRVRTGNEDAAVAGPRLAAVADGMGGHADGEVASGIAISVLRKLEAQKQHADLVGDLVAALDDVNAALRKAIRAGKGEQGMGTTITALLTDGMQLAMVHVGDSRGYRLRANVLSQMTKDQTFIQMLIDAGKLTPEDAKFHPRRSVVLQAMTGDAEIEPQAEVIETQLGDRWLICSDGLTDVVSAEQITTSLQIPDRVQAAQRLVDLALAAGAPDNVTVLVADVEEDSDVEEVPSIAGAAINPPSFTDTSPTLIEGTPSRRLVASRIRVPLLARIWVIPLATVLVLSMLFGVAAFYVNSQYYVGNSRGELVVFHGVQKLSRVDTRTHVLVRELHDPTTIRAINSHTISGGHHKVLTLIEGLLSQECSLANAEAAKASATPKPTTTARPSASPAPTTSPSPKPAASPSAAASPSPTPSPGDSAAAQRTAVCLAADGGLR